MRALLLILPLAACAPGGVEALSAAPPVAPVQLGRTMWKGSYQPPLPSVHFGTSYRIEFHTQRTGPTPGIDLVNASTETRLCFAGPGPGGTLGGTLNGEVQGDTLAATVGDGGGGPTVLEIDLTFTGDTATGRMRIVAGPCAGEEGDLVMARVVPATRPTARTYLYRDGELLLEVRER